MALVFIQLRCTPGRTYEVADAIYDREFVSELYSTSGEYDLLLKVYIPDGEDVGHYVNQRLLEIPHIARSLTTLTFKGVLRMIVDWDDAYANAPHIPGADGYPPRWEVRAAAFRAGLGARLREGLPYGSHPRQRLDLFLPAQTPRGLLVFLHGGYWRAFDRGTWSHLAAGPLEAGWAVAMPGYLLAPEARIAAITAMVATAIAAAANEVAGPIRLCGHSAGGHLVARQVCNDSRLPEDVAGRVDRVVSISGLHDLRPLLGTAMNAEALRLDAAEAAAESPALRLPRRGARVHVWVGDGERPEFVRQATLLANIWTGLGADMEQTIEPRRHHFNVIEGLSHPGSGLVEAVVGDAWG